MTMIEFLPPANKWNCPIDVIFLSQKIGLIIHWLLSCVDLLVDTHYKVGFD